MAWPQIIAAAVAAVGGLAKAMSGSGGKAPSMTVPPKQFNAAVGEAPPFVTTSSVEDSRAKRRSLFSNRYGFGAPRSEE